MMAIILLSIGLFLVVYGALAYRASFLSKKASEHGVDKLKRVRQQSRYWFNGRQWEETQSWYRLSGLSITLGELVLLICITLFILEFGMIFLAMLKHKAFLIMGLLCPFITVGGTIYFVQHKIDRRKRILLSDFIHCFSRLADFVYYREVTDYEKLRRSMIGTRLLQQALPSEVIYRTDPKETLRNMELWVGFEEERLILRNALQEALYSTPEEAEDSLMYSVENLRKRKAARWKKELKKIENFALVGPVVNAGVFTLVLIGSLLTIIQKVMGW
ncbi:hypothetical protein [Brevibacillus choshinensis]|uniref:hypothetical protein n=1 Tax=Brevibacillus choshinensis TaxID=54911 RepID=UPI002E21EBA9|nr:hypothetical protein [Brevibacillus choshinensis]